MHPTKFIKALTLLALCGALAGCNFRFQAGSQTQSGDSPLVLAMTDTPPTNVTILSAQVTLTGATLNPGNMPLLSGNTTLELTRLQTDVAYLGTPLVKAGGYTSLTLTFSNTLKLTIENDTGSAIPGAACSGTICTITLNPSIMSTTIMLQPTVTVSKNNGAGLLIDVNLNNLLSQNLVTGALQADFNAGTTLSQFTPGGAGAPPVGAEDVVGQVALIDRTHNPNTFKIQNAASVFSPAVDSTTVFLNFPAGFCTITCLNVGQILSVDIGIGFDGTPFARTVLFEDTDSSDAEVEGIVTALNPMSSQFTIIPLSESAAITGLTTGGSATVHYSTNPILTPFDVDFAQADGLQVPTTGFQFGGAAELMLGQEVQVRRNPSSSGTSINADRVRLRSSRITGTIPSSPGAPFFQLSSLSSLFRFSSPPVTQIQVQTFPQTIFAGTATSFTTLGINKSVSVRGPLFLTSGSPTLVASKALQH